MYLNIDNQGGQGKKFIWDMTRVNHSIDVVSKKTYDTLSQNQYIARKESVKPGYMEQPKEKRIGWIQYNMFWTDSFSGYMLKQFAERFTASKHLAENNKEIKKYANKVHSLLIPEKKSSDS